MTIAEILSLLSLAISLASIYLSLKVINPPRENNVPIFLPDNKILIRNGVKIEIVEKAGGFQIIQWSYRS